MTGKTALPNAAGCDPQKTHPLGRSPHWSKPTPHFDRSLYWSNREPCGASRTSTRPGGDAVHGATKSFFRGVRRPNSKATMAAFPFTEE